MLFSSTLNPFSITSLFVRSILSFFNKSSEYALLPDDKKSMYSAFVSVFVSNSSSKAIQVLKTTPAPLKNLLVYLISLVLLRIYMDNSSI